MKDWLVFCMKKTGKELLAITLDGVFDDEIIETWKLLAYENRCTVHDISVAVKRRK